MEEVSCVGGLESRSTLLAGYRPLDSPWDEMQPMCLSSSDEDSESSSQPDSDSDLDRASPLVVPSMTDSLDLYPLLGVSECSQPAPDVTASTASSLSRHTGSWVMRSQLDCSNANVVPAHSAAMPRLQAVLNKDSPISPAIEKAEIERSEKPVEINGNLVSNACKDGVRPKTVQSLKISRHAPGGNLGNTSITRSPKQRRSVPDPDLTWQRDKQRDSPRVHFSNDACVPRKQEKMLMNSSLKLGLESPSRRPLRPTSLPVASRQLTSQPRQAPDGAASRPDVVPMEPAGGSTAKPADDNVMAATGGAAVATVKRRQKSGNRQEKLQYRKSCPVGPEKEDRPSSPDGYSGYDVYNLEMSMPKIDWDAIESHLKSVREEERRRRNDRDAIRRKLAMGGEAGEEALGSGPASLAAGRPGRKPSLQSRLQAGMNLQICFMNETASDAEEEEEDEFGAGSGLMARRCSAASAQAEPDQFQSLPADLANWPKFSQPPAVARGSGSPLRASDFVRHQAQLQAEARLALAQATQMARMQMEIERQSRKSPISDVVRTAFQKIGVPFPDGRRRVSRQLLTEMNIAQLQVIVNDFHTRIEALNEALVRYLMERDEQHMEQDSKLVHIEDLTSYFGQKHADAPPPPQQQQQQTAAPPTENKRKSRGSLRLGRAK